MGFVPILLKSVLLAGLSFLLYLQVFCNEQVGLADWWSGISERWAWDTAPYCLAAALLLPVNWGLEVAKWRYLLRPIESLSIGNAWRGVLAGLTVSLFTPNRVGEYGGRIFWVSPGNRLAAVWASLVGSLAQWWLLWTGGLLVLPIVLFTSFEQFPSAEPLVLWGFWGLGLALSALLAWLYLSMPWWARRLGRWAWLRRRIDHIWKNKPRYYTRPELLRILLYAALRYSVYSAQYFWFLRFWGCPLSMPELFLAITLIFFLQTGIPIPPATGLVLRGNIALWVFAWFPGSGSAWSLLAAAWSLWLLNVVLPALVGAWVLLRHRRP